MPCFFVSSLAFRESSSAFCEEQRGVERYSCTGIGAQENGPSQLLTYTNGSHVVSRSYM